MQPNNQSPKENQAKPTSQTIDFEKPQEKSPDQGRIQFVQII